jgi:replicative DNA helicase
MEMSETQVVDRNVSALGKVPLSFLRNPAKVEKINEQDYWNRMTKAFSDSQDLNFYIDDQTGLNLLQIRAKSRKVKRQNGLDLIVIDQLSFITGATSEKQWEYIGEYTRALIQLAKELDVPVVLLAQLNRECEKRSDKRPIMADLASSGSIEQDAANVIMLYRDEVYNPDTFDKGICEVSIVKQRQGSPGVVGLSYIGEQTRFENLAYGWQPKEPQNKPERKNLSSKI